jgi:hypothetical protein
MARRRGKDPRWLSTRGSRLGPSRSQHRGQRTGNLAVIVAVHLDRVKTGWSQGSGSGRRQPASSSANISTGRLAVVPRTRITAISRHQISTRFWASARSVKDSPARSCRGRIAPPVPPAACLAVSGSGSALCRTRRAAREASTTPSDGVTHADRPVHAAASSAQIDGANRPHRKADASASMLRRARRRTVPGHSLIPQPFRQRRRRHQSLSAPTILSARLTDSCGPPEKPVGVGRQRYQPLR